MGDGHHGGHNGFDSAMYTTWIKKKDAAIYLLTKQISKIILTIFDKDILKDFQKIFQSRPIPGLYLKRFRAFQRKVLFC